MYTTDALFQSCWTTLVDVGWHSFTWEQVAQRHGQFTTEQMRECFSGRRALVLAWSGRCGIAKTDPSWPVKDKLFEIVAHRLAYSQKALAVLSSATLMGGPQFLTKLGVCVYGYFWDQLHWMPAFERTLAASTLNGIYTYVLWQTLSMTYQEALSEIDRLLDVSLSFFMGSCQKNGPSSRWQSSSRL
jgi:hypothetical protein